VNKYPLLPPPRALNLLKEVDDPSCKLSWLLAPVCNLTELTETLVNCLSSPLYEIKISRFFPSLWRFTSFK